VVVLVAGALAGLAEVGRPAVEQALAGRGLEALRSLPEPDPVDAARLEIQVSDVLARAERTAERLVLLEQALSRVLPDPLRAQLWRRKAATLGRMGRASSAAQEGRALLAWAEATGEPEALFEALTVAFMAKLPGQSREELLDRMLANARAREDRSGQCWARLWRGRELRRAGRQHEARLELEAARTLAVSTVEALEVELALAKLCVSLGSHDEARSRYAELAQRAERAGHARRAVMARGDLGKLLSDLDHPDAEPVLRQALFEAEGLSGREHLDTVRINLGWLYHRRGQLDQAAALFERCRSPEASRADWNLATNNLARVALDRGDLALAAALCEEVHEDFAPLPARGSALLEALRAEAR
jgi:tetratricopeptide (TPR) repeat protein